jgi:hypothetical protein
MKNLDVSGMTVTMMRNNTYALTGEVSGVEVSGVEILA